MATGVGENHSLFGQVVIRAETEALNKETQYRLSFTYVATFLAACYACTPTHVLSEWLLNNVPALALHIIPPTAAVAS